MGKNIILLSDGTGNSAASSTKTNVWRLYRALDLKDSNQIAYYDDGVGSQGIKVLKILGGVFGWGLKRNVLQIYKYLCRNYQPGDNIYMFGFSRGAFTVRVLNGLIAQRGLIPATPNEYDLDRQTKANYREYRRVFDRGYLSQVTGPIIRWTSAALALLFRRKVFHPIKTSPPPIKFIGVWDTVDAYGLPIDELAFIWDLLIFPIKFPDYRLSPIVEKACHAVSIDDERHTFHPLLWDESHEDDPDRIEQVWFAGVHANVGGGYAQDELSFVPLDWMMSKCQNLTFINRDRDWITEHANPHGTQHNSRAGLGTYYRYKPRNIAHLCHDDFLGVKIKTPVIHQSVFDRIQNNVTPYAPLSIPENYKIYPYSPTIPPLQYETGDDRTARVENLEYARDWVFWRRWLYWILLSVTAVLLASGFFLGENNEGLFSGWLEFLNPAANFLANTLSAAKDFLPDIMETWINSLVLNPRWLFGFIASAVVLFALKRYARRETRLNAMIAWSHLKGLPAQSPKRRFWRVARWLRGIVGVKTKRTASLIGATLMFALLLFMIERATFKVRSGVGLLCEKVNSAKLVTVGTSHTFTFDVSNPCMATKIKLAANKKYRFDVKPADGAKEFNWQDGPNIMAGPNGFIKPEDNSSLALFTPLRRIWAEPWFKLMGQIGHDEAEQFAIGDGHKIIEPTDSGALYLFVNDAVFGFGPGGSDHSSPRHDYWAWPYFWSTGKNIGRAQITVTEVVE